MAAAAAAIEDPRPCGAQRVLRGRITFTPKCGGYEFEAPTRFDKLFLGVAVEISTKRKVSYKGTEYIGSADTFDADYGRLLEVVQRSWLGSIVMSFGSVS